MAITRAAARAILVLAALLLATPARVAADLVILEAERKVDVSTQRATIKSVLKLKNEGKAEVANVILCEPAALHEHRADQEVTQFIDGKMAKLGAGAPATPGGAPAGVACETFALAAPAGAGAEVEVGTAGVYTGVLTPKPREVRQKDAQRVVYSGDSATLVSPYRVATQKTEVALASSKVESFTRLPNGRVKGSVLEYGPFTDSAPFTVTPVSVHSENNSPFAAAHRVEREIEVSHWGNAYFEERYHMYHAGAKLVGEWSRFDYQVQPVASQSAIKDYTAVVAPHAHSLYFRDEIGNISSSEVSRGVRAASVRLQQRYPLFGGWSVKFLFGWGVPLADVVSKGEGGKYVLTTALSPSVSNLVVDELVLRVVLPEGATDVEVSARDELARTFEKKYTYLDVMGRTVVVLEGRNFVPEMNRPLTVSYRFSNLALLQKPLLLVALFAAIFAAIAACSSSGAAGLAKRASAASLTLAKPHAE